MRPFVHLHNHSDFSLLDGASRVEDMVALAAKYKMPAVALTDHGNMFGAMTFYQAAKKHGVKPILGCETYVAPNSRFDKSSGGSIADTNNHLVLLATNNTGYRNLVKLVSSGYLEGFYYKPRIDKELLSQHSEGLIGLSACLKGEVPQAALRGNDARAVRAAGEYEDILGKGNFFLEIQDHASGSADEKTVNTHLMELARKEGIGTVATNDCHYLSQDDADAHDILLCIGTGKKHADEQRMRYPGDQFYFKSSEEMAQLFQGYEEAYDNTLQIAERVDINLERDGFLLPKFDVPDDTTESEYFERVVWEGFRQRWNQLEPIAASQGRYTLADYEARVKREIDIIHDMGFPSYFLITWDFIRFAREKGIPVGPGRGSAAGSLVAFSLRITDIDPLEHDLIFERFLNPERISMPDIDIDFCEARRGEVIDYVTEKYGRDNVAQIITFGTMKARAVLRDVGRVLDIPYAEVDRIAKLVPATLDATLEKALEEVPQLKEATMMDERVNQLVEIAKRLEGVSRHASTHAAGVVIAPEPLTEYLPLYRGSKGEITTQFPMKDCEDIGLLKMDFLGLRTLTLIDNCVKMLKEQQQIEIDLNALPLDDAKTYELFSEGQTFGVFQFESEGMRDILRRFKPSTLNDLTALNALYRPGPIRSGMIDDFIKRKKNPGSVRYELPALEEILKPTLGVIVYQEQVMKIASKLAGFSLGQADLLRKAMGKKKADVMQGQREKFIKGAVANGIPDAKATKIFELMEHFGGYGFNRSHSAAYAFLAFQTAYLKANYPVYFMAALLTSERTNTDKVVQYIKTCADMGIEVLPPNVNESALNFTVVGENIRFGLAAVKNVGDGAIESILSARRDNGVFHSLADVCELVDLRSVNKRVLEALVKSGSFDDFKFGRAQLAHQIDRSLEYGQTLQKDKASGQGSLFGDSAVQRPASLDAGPEVPPWSELEILAGEKENLGFFLSGHPLDSYQDEIRRYATCTTANLADKAVDDERQDRPGPPPRGYKKDGKEVTLVGLIASVRQLRTRKGDAMAVIRVEDQFGAADVVVFPDCYRDCFSAICADAIVVIKGKPELEETGPKILASKIASLEEVQHSVASSMTVRVPLAHFIEESLPHLRELLESHRGECELRFELEREDFAVLLKPHPYLKVEPSSDLVAGLEALCGRGTVSMSTRQ